MIDTPPASRRPFFWVLALFFAPLLVAFALYYASPWRPEGRTNKGELIAPAVALPAVTLTLANGQPTGPDWLRRRWSLVYLSDAPCRERCQASLRTLQLVRQLLGKDIQRTTPVWLVRGTCCAADTPAANADLVVVNVATEAAAALLAAFPAPPEGLFAADRIYVVDPLGNLMMRYATGVDARDIYQDLKKLLALSHIG